MNLAPSDSLRTWSFAAPSPETARDQSAEIGGSDEGAPTDLDGGQLPGTDHALQRPRGKTKRIGRFAQGEQLDRRAPLGWPLVAFHGSLSQRTAYYP
jgi:hypothetical protein